MLHEINIAWNGHCHIRDLILKARYYRENQRGKKIWSRKTIAQTRCRKFNNGNIKIKLNECREPGKWAQAKTIVQTIKLVNYVYHNRIHMYEYAMPNSTWKGSILLVSVVHCRRAAEAATVKTSHIPKCYAFITLFDCCYYKAPVQKSWYDVVPAKRGESSATTIVRLKM